MQRPLCDIFHTMLEDTRPSLYDTLMALKPADLSPNAWAGRAKVNRNIFTDIRNRGNVKQDTLEKLLEAIGVDLGAFQARRSLVKTEVVSAGGGDVMASYRGEEPLRHLPVLGSAIGGEYGGVDEHVELTELHLGEVLDWVARPSSLAGDSKAYALTILGESMSPKFEPGARVAVSPRAPVAIGDYVIVQLRGEDDGDDRVKMVLIKRLVRRSATFVELEQFNPAVTFTVEQRRVAAMHKVMGEIF